MNKTYDKAKDCKTYPAHTNTLERNILGKQTSMASGAQPAVSRPLIKAEIMVNPIVQPYTQRDRQNSIT